MGPDDMIFIFWMLSFKTTFSFFSFTFIKRLFSSSSISAIMVVPSTHLRLLIFLPAVLPNNKLPLGHISLRSIPKKLCLTSEMRYQDGNNNPVYETVKETLMYRTVFWTLWERERVGRFGRMALKHVYYHVWNELPVQVRCMILDAWG